MNRRQRALSRVDLDAYARSRGMRDAAAFDYVVRLIHRVANGARVSAEDVGGMAGHALGLPQNEWQRGRDWANSGATSKERASRVARILAFGLAHQHPDTRVDAGDILARALRYGETLAVQDASAQVTGKLTERDAHRDRHAGIDQAQRAEAAKRAAMHNPDAIRRRDIERAAAQHQAPTPTFYTAERRELLAQANERIADRFMRQYVRDADPHRRPDRGDDRRADIALQIDRRVVEDASRDELALAENPLLEVVDNIATAEEVIERAKEE